MKPKSKNHKQKKNPLDYYMRLKYPVQVSEEDDGDGTYYFVRVPDLPGCMSHGATLEEAMRNVEEAKRVWMEARIEAGLPIPEPVAEARYSGRLLIRAPKSLHQRLAERAQREGVSLNQLVVYLLSQQVSGASS